MRYFIIAGEASGDLYGAKLISELKKLDNQADFKFFGGDKMQSQYPTGLIRHYRDTAFMGVVEVLKNYKTIKTNFSLAQKNILDFNPNAVILIDYPGFNLKIAEFAKKNGFKVFYYISPKVWVWKKNRVFTIKKYVDKLFVIFPFEVEFYKKYGIEVDYFGNPLVEVVEDFQKSNFDKNEFLAKNKIHKPIVALLPGSRQQEIVKITPYYNILAKKYPQINFIVAALSSMKEFYYSLSDLPNLKILYDQTYEILTVADFAIVTSGTATLETALFNVPQIVTYLPGAVFYHLAKVVVKVKYISLVNLILDKPLVEEIIHKNFEQRLLSSFESLISNKEKQDKIFSGYKALRKILGYNTEVSKNIAQRIIFYTKK